MNHSSSPRSRPTTIFFLGIAGIAALVGGIVVARGASTRAGSSGTLVLTCPPLAKVYCSMGTMPSLTGEAVATSTVDPAPTVTYVDTLVNISNCPTDRFEHVVMRRWSAFDSAGNSAECDQQIDVIKDLFLLDIKPTSCPNPIQTGSNGGGATVSMAVVGTLAQSVVDIVPGSIQLWREGCQRGPVTPISWGYEDVAGPHAPRQACDCGTAGPDGTIDLRLGFSRQQIVDLLGLKGLPNGTMVPLVVTGTLTNGCRFRASDCVRIQG
ncbi:MAG: hypothetical protein RIR65_2576 [Planctomycetota bacterium]